MDRTTAPATHRRSFLGRLGAAAAAFAATGVVPARAVAATASGQQPSDKWIEAMKAKHRQIFDMPHHEHGLTLIHVRNYLHTYQSAYAQKPGADVKAAASLYGLTVPLAFNDAMWAKYKLGAAVNVKDSSTKAPATVNVFAKAPAGSQTLAIEGSLLPIPADASITALQATGTIFLLCNNAFNFWAGRLAQATGQQAKAVRAELEANMLPGIVIVPAMVIAFDLAQENGISYMRLV